MFDINKIYNEDCLEGMKRIPDGSVDMVLCDLPYGTTCNRWDAIIPFEPLWEQYHRVCKRNAAILLFSQQPFTSLVIASNMKDFRYEWVWKKTCPTGFANANKMPMKAHENIIVFYKKLPIFNPIKWKSRVIGKSFSTVQSNNYQFIRRVPYQGDSEGLRFPIDVIEFGPDKDRCNSSRIHKERHPCQKPVALCEYLIKTYTNDGETVLDNCMGSGTTAVACINTGRNFIGFELEKAYWEICQKRITEAYENQQLNNSTINN